MAKNWEPIETIANKINSGQSKAVDLVNESLKMIENNKEYNAILLTLKEEALTRAEQIDKSVLDKKYAGRLAGVPFIAKDNFLVKGSETTAASNMLKGFIAPYQATAINKLEAEGAICVAKANLDAFAHGASTENSDFGLTKNPIDKTRVAGGSSGGSAAAVALGLAPFALGTDTGGSIRQPASFCGVVGLKPSYGLVSRSGVVAMGSSLDCIGPLTRTVEDACLVLDIISGKDGLDSTMVERDNAGYLVKPKTLKNIRIGIIKEYLGLGISDEVLSVTNANCKKLEKAGAKVTEISLPSLSLALACYYILCPAEVSSNLSRYDGQRYGYSDGSASSLDESYKLSRGNGFGKEAKRRIMIGTYVLSSGYYDAYYKKAQILRTKLIKEFTEAFKDVDYLVGPVAPTTAFKIGQNNNDPMAMYLSDVMTVAANLTGIPSISLPGTSNNNDLPIGFQLMANRNKDRELLALSMSIMELIK